jgi:hypothetical protein
VTLARQNGQHFDAEIVMAQFDEHANLCYNKSAGIRKPTRSYTYTYKEAAMRHRLYYMLPDIPSARAILDELLCKRIECRHIHFMATEGTLPRDMPDANFLHKTDLVHGAQTGMIIGGGAGLIVGVLLVMFPPEGLSLQTMAILVAGIGGALFGAWASGMNAAAVPNSRLAQFSQRIAEGQVLLMVDVPHTRIQEIEDLIKSRHPEVNFAGEDPHIPVFP